jgi:hypothetical protein
LRLKGVKLNGGTPEKTASAKAAHMKNFANAGGEKFLDECEASRDGDWLACSLRAQSLEQVEACN